jgi:uncharacterized membrane protein
MYRFRDFFSIIILNVFLIMLMAFGDTNANSMVGIVRIVVALIYLAFVPGYTLQEALLPNRDHLVLLDRVAISIGLSVAILPLMGLILDGPLGGIRLWQSITFLTLFTLIFMLIAIYRRRTLTKPEEKTTFTTGTSLKAWWHSQGRSNRVVFILLIFVVSASLFTATINFVTPKPDQHFTEFYLVGPEELTLNYPYLVLAGKPFTLKVGVINHEGQSATYSSIEARMNGLTLAGTAPFTLTDGQSILLDMKLTSSMPGDQQLLEILLLQNDKIYRRLYLRLNVKSP